MIKTLIVMIACFIIIIWIAMAIIFKIIDRIKDD